MANAAKTHFVASWSNVDPRNYVFAGNTGTRALAVRPQTRFEDGVELAKAVIAQKRISNSSSHSLSLHSVVTRAVQHVRDLFG